MRLLFLSLGFAALAGCGKSENRAGTDTARADSAREASTPATGARVETASPGAVASPRDTGAYHVIRGLYLNRFAAQSRAKLSHLLRIADSSEINGFVIDMKDEFGLNYKSANSKFARNAGGTHGFVPNVKTLLDSVKAHGLIPIARIVVFKDPVAAALNPGWTIKTPDGGVWRDEKGHAWVNPYSKEVWEYNLGVAEELAAAGFDEIQFDYIRFPEPYKRLAKQVFPGNEGVSKPDLLAEFLKEAKTRLHKLDVQSTADIFGLVTTVRGPLEVGQWWEKLSPHVDVLLPMVYPSHYPRGSFGIAHPNSEPYRVIKIAIDTARVRDEKLGITRAEHVRPWIQAFSIGKPAYGAEHIAAQKKAVYDAGYQGWVMWSPGSHYDSFVPALEKTKPCAFYGHAGSPRCAEAAAARAPDSERRGTSGDTSR